MKRFLERILIGRYGALSDKEIEPLAPGLNVIYGPNEAGKSSIASFIGGVLFGWEEARGVRNTYRPSDGERSGSLVFREVLDGFSASRESGEMGLALGDADELAAIQAHEAQDRFPSYVSRVRNEDGLQGDASIVSDIDSATYRTMFWLTSDELRSLKNTSDVTARLLAAGSGTGQSPANAYVQIEQRIAALAGPVALEGSIAQLDAQLEEKRGQIALATENVELSKQQDRERAALSQSRAATSQRLDKMNARIEGLNAARARIASIDARIAENDSELSRLEAERRLSEEEEAAAVDAVVSDSGDPVDGVGSRLLDLDAASERALRGRLDELADEQTKITRALDVAKENSAASSAAYEALVEIDEDDVRAGRNASNRRVQVVVSVLLPIIFIVASILMFVYGRQTRSLSFTVFGVALVFFAFLLAAGAFFVLFRPNKGAEAFKTRQQDAHWVMLQDQKRLDASLEAKRELEDRITSFFEENGLGAAGNSIRHARALLDDAREARSKISLARQRSASIALRIGEIEKGLAALRTERAQVEADCDLPVQSTLDQVDALIRELVEERDALSAAYDEMNYRYGELEQLLAAAAQDRTLDQLKIESQQIHCRLREAKHELIKLLLAKRILDRSVAAWESRSQPEVYAQASRLFAQMTGGAWTGMHMTAEGHLVAMSSSGEAREVRHLSLGTCQQLYLALRVAMLQHASSVGCAIPVLADDILVNFDAVRRRAAADVLAELARSRQVIVFTCHRETVDALRDADADLMLIEL